MLGDHVETITQTYHMIHTWRTYCRDVVHSPTFLLLPFHQLWAWSRGCLCFLFGARGRWLLGSRHGLSPNPNSTSLKPPISRILPLILTSTDRFADPANLSDKACHLSPPRQVSQVAWKPLVWFPFWGKNWPIHIAGTVGWAQFSWRRVESWRNKVGPRASSK